MCDSHGVSGVDRTRCLYHAALGGDTVFTQGGTTRQGAMSADHGKHGAVV